MILITMRRHKKSKAINTSKSAPGLFEGTSWYYSRYRPGYPAEAIEVLVRRFELNASTHVLDLGCGTGQIAIPLAARGVPVHAVDPDVEMLGEGLRAEEKAAAHGVAWIRGDDKSLEYLHLPSLVLCTMGASFHWMDRDRILRTLDSMIVGKGGIAVLSGTSVWARSEHCREQSSQEGGWPSVVKEVVVEFLGQERRAGAGVYNHPKDRHEVVLARSPFTKVEKLTIVASQSLTVDQIVGLQLSTSYASPAQLLGRVDEFKKVLSDRLTSLEPSGLFRSETTTEIILGTR